MQHRGCTSPKGGGGVSNCFYINVAYGWMPVCMARWLCKQSQPAVNMVGGTDWSDISHCAGPLYCLALSSNPRLQGMGLLLIVLRLCLSDYTHQQPIILPLLTCMSFGGHCFMTCRSSCKFTMPRLPQPASKNLPLSPPSRDHSRSRTRGMASVLSRGLGCLSSCCSTSIPAACCCN